MNCGAMPDSGEAAGGCSTWWLACPGLMRMALCSARVVWKGDDMCRVVDALRAGGLARQQPVRRRARNQAESQAPTRVSKLWRARDERHVWRNYDGALVVPWQVHGVV